MLIILFRGPRENITQTEEYAKIWMNGGKVWLPWEGRLFPATLLLLLPKEEVFKKSMMGGEFGNTEAGKSIKESGFKDICSTKGGRPSKGYAKLRRAFTGSKHVLGRQWSVSFADHF